MEKKKYATVIDVARLAGVSPSTVSRAFDSKWEGRISKKTLAAVRAAAAELDYYGASALARGVMSRRSGIVALVMGKTVGYFYLEIIMKFVGRIQATGRQVLIFEADPSSDLDAIVSRVHQYRVDAIVITSGATSDNIIDYFSGAAMPVIVFNRDARGSDLSAVYCDSLSAGAKAADFLLDNGHREFAVITGDDNSSKELERVNGFCRRASARGGRLLRVIQGDYFYESGYRCAQEILRDLRPDAIFCCEDTIAMGAMDAARKLFSLRVPERLSVLGFDASSVGRFGSYDLTTMAYPLDPMIDCVVELIDQLWEHPGEQIRRAFDMEITIRGSVKLKN